MIWDTALWCRGMISRDSVLPSSQPCMQRCQESRRVLRVCSRIECLIEGVESGRMAAKIDLKTTYVDVADATVLQRADLLKCTGLVVGKKWLAAGIYRPGCGNHATQRWVPFAAFYPADGTQQANGQGIFTFGVAACLFTRRIRPSNNLCMGRTARTPADRTGLASAWAFTVSGGDGGGGARQPIRLGDRLARRAGHHAGIVLPIQ